MDRVEVSTVVYLPPEEVYEFLEDFPRYADYSEHLREVRVRGDGSPGTRYDITVAWWKLSYTAHSQVTGVDPPNRIDWRLTREIDAEGYWGIEPASGEAPTHEDHASRVRLSIGFDPESADAGALDLPRLVSFDWVVEKVKPLVRREAEHVVERIVTDLEGRPRPVDLEIHASPDAV